MRKAIDVTPLSKEKTALARTAKERKTSSRTNPPKNDTPTNDRSNPLLPPGTGNSKAGNNPTTPTRSVVRSGGDDMVRGETPEAQ